jgi:hypothetical protein
MLTGLHTVKLGLTNKSGCYFRCKDILYKELSHVKFAGKDF